MFNVGSAFRSLWAWVTGAEGKAIVSAFQRWLSDWATRYVLKIGPLLQERILALQSDPTLTGPQKFGLLARTAARQIMYDLEKGALSAVEAAALVKIEGLPEVTRDAVRDALAAMLDKSHDVPVLTSKLESRLKVVVDDVKTRLKEAEAEATKPPTVER